MNVEKHFLYEIIRLSFIAKNSLTNIPDRTSITSEEQSQRFAIAPLDIMRSEFRLQSRSIREYRSTVPPPRFHSAWPIDMAGNRDVVNELIESVKR